MTKRHFIAMADAIREHNRVCNRTTAGMYQAFTNGQIAALADFCQSQNSMFNRERWLDYIAGKCGKNGGKVK